MAGCRGPVAAHDLRRRHARLRERLTPAALALRRGERADGTGEVVDARRTGSQQMRRRSARTRGVVGLHGAGGGRRPVGRRVHDDDREPLGKVQSAGEGGRLVEDDGAVDALVVQPLERVGDGVATRGRDDGQRESARRGRVGDRLQHAGVADGGEGRHDEADRVGATGAQRPGGAMHAVAELGHRGLDARTSGRIDPRAGVHHSRHRLRRDPRRRGHIRHRDSSRHVAILRRDAGGSARVDDNTTAG